MALDGRRTLSGTWGQIWIDGVLIAEIKKAEFKTTVNREDIQLGIDVDSKMTGLKGEFTLTLQKTYTMYNTYAKKYSSGEDLRVQIISNLKDPDAVKKQADRWSFPNCWFNELPLVNWEKGGVIEDELSGGFPPSLAKNLDAIKRV